MDIFDGSHLVACCQHCSKRSPPLDAHVLHGVLNLKILHVFLKYANEMEAKLDQLRRLVETADRDKVELMNQLEEEKRSSLKILYILLDYCKRTRKFM